MARILVADDEADVRDLVRYALAKSKHELIETSTGLETLARLKKGPVDLAILDVMLPGMDGYTILLQASQDPNIKPFPVIVMTAVHPTKSLFSKFPQVKQFVLKPFDPVALAATIERTLEQAAGA